MKKLLLLFSLVLILVTGCSNTVDFSVEYLGINTEDSTVKKWIESNGTASGIYLGKTKESKEGYKYYLYVNYANPAEQKSINSISVKSNGKESLLIDTKIRKSDQVDSEKLFCVSVIGSSLDYIVLNGEEIKTSSISNIE